MNIAIINGSNRMGDKNIKVSEEVLTIAKKIDLNAQIIDLKDFTHLFREEYILVVENSDKEQQKQLYQIQESDFILIVTPISFSLPKGLENFLELTKNFNIYNMKLIGIIATSHHTNVLVETQVFQKRLKKYFKNLEATVISEMITVDYDKIDRKKIKEYLEYCMAYWKLLNG